MEGYFNYDDDFPIIITKTGVHRLNYLDFGSKYKLLVGDRIRVDKNSVKIIERTKEPIYGILYISSKITYGVSKSGSVKYKFVPANGRQPFFIVGTKKPKQVYDIYVSIKFDNWDGINPLGSIINIIGDVGNIDVEYEYLKLTATSKWTNLKIKDYTEYTKDLTPIRTNLTDKQVITIDPEGCIDIDDGLHIIEEKDFYEVGVHIADVSSYIPVDSVLDIEIRKRIESIYLDDKQINMIPKEISIEHCSLLEKTNKRAFSVIFIINKNGKIKDVLFKKSIIKVDKNFSYDLVQNMIDTNADTIYTNNLKLLYDLGKKIDPMMMNYDVHKMVEVYMVLANSYVAAKLYEIIKEKSIVRKHIGITKYDFSNIDKKLVDKFTNYNTEAAIYDFGSDDSRHMGLNKQFYTHFTSPIRRYCDIIVHRQLYSCINDKNVNFQNVTYDLLDHMNRMHSFYKKIERLYYTINVIYKLDIDKIHDFDGYIVGINDDRVKIFVPKINLDIDIKIYSPKLNHLIKKKEISYGFELTSMENSNKVTLKLFDKVKIKIGITIRDKRKIKTQIVEPDLTKLFGDFVYDCDY